MSDKRHNEEMKPAGGGLRRDIALVLACKLLALLLLYGTLFSPSHRPSIDTGARLFDPARR